MIRRLDFNLLLFLGVLFFIFFLLFYKLDSTYLTNWDEAWYADISRNMAESANFLTPVWNKEVFFEKPPLYFWFSALSFKLFGVSEFSARFPSVAAALGIALVVYFLAKEIFNQKIGIVSLFILFSSIEFLYRSRTGNLDTLLTFFMTFSLFSFFKAKNGNKKWFLLMGVSVGLGFLTKGFVGLYPLVVVMLFLLFRDERKILKEKYFLASIVVAFLLAGGWFLLSFFINGKPFINQFLLANTEKFGFGFNIFHNFSFAYVGHLKSGLKIWFPFLIISFAFLLFQIKEKKTIILLSYPLIFLFIMSFSNNKSNWFILPLYPIFSLMIACVFYQIGKKFWFFIFIIFLATALFQNYIYKESYIAADIAGDEARAALAAKKLTKDTESIYLTNYYYPTIVYYSQRKVYALYSEQEKNTSWWIKPKTDWTNVLKTPSVVITTVEELRELQKTFPLYKIVVLFQSGNKLVVKRI